MPMISYTVRCTFTDAAVADKWCRWMLEGHLAGVCAAGAIRAELVRIDPPDPTELASSGPHDSPVPAPTVIYEARYLFSDRDSFLRYETESAPALRAEGLARFPTERGLAYERSTAEVLGVAHEIGLGLEGADTSGARRASPGTDGE